MLSEILFASTKVEKPLQTPILPEWLVCQESESGRFVGTGILPVAS